MKEKTKRIWTPEQKAAAAVRMKEVQRKRWEKVHKTAVGEAPKVSGTSEAPHAVVEAPVDYEKPDPNDPRFKRLLGKQASFLATHEAQEAIERAEILKVHRQMDRGIKTVITADTGDTPDNWKGRIAHAEGKNLVDRANPQPNVNVDITQLQSGRIGSKELRLIVRTDGTVVSQFDTCLCGAQKNEWHRHKIVEREN